MQASCEKFIKSVACDEAAALCKTVIDVFRSFGWSGDITIPDLGWANQFVGPMTKYTLDAISPGLGETVSVGSASALDQAAIAAATEEEVASWNLRERYNSGELRSYEVSKDEISVGVYDLYEAQVGEAKQPNWDDATLFFNEYATQILSGEEFQVADKEELRKAKQQKALETKFLEDMTAKDSEVSKYTEEHAKEQETVQSEGASIWNETVVINGFASVGFLAVCYFMYTMMCSSGYQKYQFGKVAIEDDSI